MSSVVPGDTESISPATNSAPSASLGQWGLFLLTSFFTRQDPALDVTKSPVHLGDEVVMEVSAVSEFPRQPAHSGKFFLECGSQPAGRESKQGTQFQAPVRATVLQNPADSVHFKPP